MKLHDSLDHAVADVSADLPALVAGSRRQGLSIRRRRRALATVGTAAAVSVLALGAYALVPGDQGPSDTGVATDIASPVPVGALSGRTAPITSGGVAAALAATVEDVADGTFGRFQGDASNREGSAALLFEPENGSGPAGQVFINLQPLAMAGQAPYTCEGYLEDYLTDCTVRQLPNGDTLRTYREDDDTEVGAGSQRVVAEVLRPEQRLRILVFARNSNPWAIGELRARPVLTTEQLIEIATQPWWSRTELPVEYVEAGNDLELYQN
ncbi:hypothetical protein ASC77_19095 [Nocardioides sp. Root1257]|uniref:hypothetical protein n=1 Tax=unclassified Nocardioides TaxID=2615069 RepID=UPI0006FF0F4D|nr:MULTISPECIES: hypothetical protein [unclassified Nocardioides]KQW46012.1 hypothetical protein ASC77_19095 [Nocardioides sp. Root1257]KRC43275.1 hypothetical protein ASE24_20060 [Nocardioides sp. Root224]